MNSRKSLSLEAFTLVISNPANRMTSFSVSVSGDGRVNMNGKLAAQLGRQPLLFAFTPDGKHLAFKPQEEKGSITFPKNGSKKLAEALQAVKSNKIPIPARYEVWLNEDGNFWQGDLTENPTLSQQQKLHSSKKRF